MDERSKLTENFGKVLGRPVLPEQDPFEIYARIITTGRKLRPFLPYPRGVFRFKTLEAADLWQMKHIMKKAVET